MPPIDPQRFAEYWDAMLAEYDKRIALHEQHNEPLMAQMFHVSKDAVRAARHEAYASLKDDPEYAAAVTGQVGAIIEASAVKAFIETVGPYLQKAITGVLLA